MTIDNPGRIDNVDDFLAHAISVGGMETEDLRASLLPLLYQVSSMHALGMVAPLRGLAALQIDDQFRLSLPEGSARPPSRNRARLKEVQRSESATFHVLGERRVTIDVDGGMHSDDVLDVLGSEELPTRPAYVAGYEVWEHRVGHHDPTTDIGSLGLLLASLALGLDFRVRADLEQFVAARRNLFRLQPRLHPVIGRLITEMTTPDRNRRAQDLAAIADRLDSYRDQPVDFDLSLVSGAASGPILGRRAAIQVALRDRLFEINRRNRLLHFTPSQQSLNVTLGSVPLLMDVRNIHPDQIATWREPLARDVLKGKQIRLNTVLRFDDAPYLPGVLDKLISQTRRDRTEFGMAQLRLVVCFLRWHNLKEVKDERVNSPLLLLPIEVTKKRGVRDSYVLTGTSPVAEVNPALRHHLRQLYAIDMPETVDLSEQTVGDLHALLQAQIQATEPGVVLEMVDRPKLEMVHQRAKFRLDQYRRRRGTAMRVSEPRSMPYSYAPGDFRPLGIQLFEQKVRYQPPSSLRLAAGAPPDPRRPQLSPQDEGPTVVTEKRTYSLNDPSTGNPYQWEFDLCALTIGNFNYRKMTLVRDYNQLIAADEPSDAFDRIFSLDARPLDHDLKADIALEDQLLVVAADETQRAALARARGGRSFIIQGPPGTGKSQTITNLIADYVGHGKRVLFVCEKRAAIDVVYARLRQQGLDELCALIHDSQADKRPFIQGLRTTYESWLADVDSAGAAEVRRADLLAAIQGRLGLLRRIESAMAETPEGSDRDVRTLLERASELADAADETDGSALPSVAEWYRHEHLVRQIGRTLERLGEPPILSLHPISDVRASLIESERPVEALERSSGELLAAMVDIAISFTTLQARSAELTVDELRDLCGLAALAVGFHRDVLTALQPGSPAALALLKDAETMQQLEEAATAAASLTIGWTQPFSPLDAEAGLVVAREKEGSALKFLAARWRALKKAVKARYDFSRHAVAPTVTKLLTDLVALHHAEAALAAARADAMTRYGTHDLSYAVAAVRRVHAATGQVGLVRDRVVSGAQPDHLASALPRLSAVLAAVDRTFDTVGKRSLDEVRQRAEQLRGATGALRELLADIRQLHLAAPAVTVAVRTLRCTPDSLERAIVVRALDQYGLRNSDVERFTGRELAGHISALASERLALMDANAALIRARARDRFRQHVALAATSASQLQPEQKLFKKAYTAGRRELEHEFQKTMRYRSIRDLAGGAPGPVVMDLRPIWLMSPTSVSDTLPLDPSQFDVVVFDEASQIPLEEAIPALYRSHQTIVVGDRMQLPPTQFFGPGRSDEDELEIDGDDGQRVAIVLDGDSFLAQSAASLPSTMLAWHYRSRSEELIGFSNAAFYGGGLATVPDRHRPLGSLDPISVDGDWSGELGVDAMLARNVSFHFVPHGVYEARRNPAEAAYIAEMVRALLGRGSGLTVGIAAFSEAQQSEIEDALERLGESDSAFGELLETEEQREDDDQFVGLFVKNLENIQGDERDVVIMSVCYAPGPDGRMIMNFGPINQQGGEKRLNVIFSRARRHMAIVSSIRSTQITNDHNDGANALRRFLEYAEALSVGNHERAGLVLDAANPLRRSQLDVSDRTPVVSKLAEALRTAGLHVVADHGRSRFRCDLAVRRTSIHDHEVAVLIDSRSRAAFATTEERALTHPAVLTAFGWKVVHVLTKDWYDDPESVVRSVIDALDENRR